MKQLIWRRTSWIGWRTKKIEDQITETKNLNWSQEKQQAKSKNHKKADHLYTTRQTCLVSTSYYLQKQAYGYLRDG